MIATLIATQLALANSFHMPWIMTPFLGLTIDVALRLKPRRGSFSAVSKDIVAQSKVNLIMIRAIRV